MEKNQVIRQRMKFLAVLRLLQLCAVKSDDVVTIDGPQSVLHGFSPLGNSSPETVYLPRPLEASRIKKKSYLHPIPGSVGWGLEQPGVVEGVLAHSRRLEQNNFWSPFQSKLSFDSIKCHNQKWRKKGGKNLQIYVVKEESASPPASAISFNFPFLIYYYQEETPQLRSCLVQQLGC